MSSAHTLEGWVSAWVISPPQAVQFYPEEESISCIKTRLKVKVIFPTEYSAGIWWSPSWTSQSHSTVTTGTGDNSCHLKGGKYIAKPLKYNALQNTPIMAKCWDCGEPCAGWRGGKSGWCLPFSWHTWEVQRWVCKKTWSPPWGSSARIPEPA